MTETKPDTQETRPVTVGVRVTEVEKDAIDLVVKVRRPAGGVGELLRERTLTEVVAEGRRMVDRLAEGLAEDAA